MDSSNGLSNNHSATMNGSITHHTGDSDTVGNQTYSVRDVEIIRIIGQFLFDLGFKNTYNSLVRESGIVLEHKAASYLRQNILDGDWDAAEGAINDLRPLISNMDELEEMRFLLLEQRFLEHLENSEFHEALMILRNHIAPMQRNTQRVHTLASCIMCRDLDELKTMASWSGKHGGSRNSLVERLQRCIPPVAMLPPRRMDALMMDAVQKQIIDCRFHNSCLPIESVSLLTAHVCDRSQFPSLCLQKLSHHDNELNMCVFSPNGLHLATGGKDGQVNLWSVDQSSHSVEHAKVIDGNLSTIKFLNWSPDSKKLAVCCGEEQSSTNVYLVESGEKRCSYRIHEDDDYIAAAFFHDSRMLAFGGQKGQFYIVDTEDPSSGPVVQIEGYRVQSMASSYNSSTGEDVLITADTLNRVRAFKFSFNPVVIGSQRTVGGRLADSSRVTSSSAGNVTSAGGISVGGNVLTNSSSSSSSSSNTGLSMASAAAASFLSQAAGSVLFSSAVFSSVAGETTSSSANIPSEQQDNPTSISTPSLTSTGVGITEAAGLFINVTSSGPSTTLIGGEGVGALVSGASTPTLSTGALHLQAAQHTAGYSGNSSDSSALPGQSEHLKSHETLFQETHAIQNLVLSQCGRFALITLHKMGLTLWDLNDRVIISRFQGFKQDRHLVQIPTFGGLNEDFIACGSDDGQLHIWHRKQSKPILSVEGHTCNGPVTCVHWNPALPSMLANINDDGELRIWGPEKYRRGSVEAMVTE